MSTEAAPPSPETTPRPPGSPSSEDEQRWTPRLVILLVILSLALFLDILDASMVAIALPSIGAELGMETAQLQWIVTGYVLGFGGLLLLGGRAGDLLGRRNVFLVSMAVFALASLVGTIAVDPNLLIATRFIKGIAAAFSAPAALSIIVTTFAEGKQRNQAVSIYTVFGAFGFSSGMIFGGLLTSLGWRWTFFFPVPIALAAVVIGFFLIPRVRSTVRSGFDIPGAVTLAAAMLLLVHTVVTAPENGWAHPITLLSFAGAALLFAAFVVIEQRVRNPLVRLGILRNGALLRANVGMLTLIGSFATFQFLLTLYLQQAVGQSPIQVAMALLPVGVLVALSVFVAGRIIGRFGTETLITVGLMALAVGYLLFLRIDTDPSYLTMLLPTTLLLGVGFALAFPSVNVQATAGVAPEEQGLAAGLVQTSGQLGAAIFLAITTALIAVDHATGEGAAQVSADQMLSQFQPGLHVVVGVGLGGVLLTLVPRLLSRRKIKEGA